MTEMAIGNSLTSLSIPKHILQSLDRTSPSDVSSTENRQNQLSIPISGELDWNVLQLQLLLELIQWAYAKEGKLSQRNFAKMIGVSRSTLAARIRSIIDEGMIEGERLAGMIGLKDR